MLEAHTKAGLEYNITLHKRFTSPTLLQTEFFIYKSKHGSEFKQRKVNYTHDTHRRPSMHITPHQCSPIQAHKHLE
jgi:hypothetical protein